MKQLFFILFTAIVLTGCNNNHTPLIVNDSSYASSKEGIHTADSLEHIQDSLERLKNYLLDELLSSLKFRDSCLYFNNKMDEAQDLYSSTGNEKYSRLFYHYQDMYNYYVHKNNEIYRRTHK